MSNVEQFSTNMVPEFIVGRPLPVLDSDEDLWLVQVEVDDPHAEARVMDKALRNEKIVYLQYPTLACPETAQVVSAREMYTDNMWLMLLNLHVTGDQLEHLIDANEY